MLPLVFSVNALQPGTPDNYYYEAPAGSYLVPFGAATGPGLSSATARDLLGWTPTVPFADGLQRYFDWHVAPKRAW